jgi:hypothetical protein
LRLSLVSCPIYVSPAATRTKPGPDYALSRATANR